MESLDWIEQQRRELTHQDAERRLLAAVALAQLGNFEGKEALLDALSDKQDWVRLQAAEILEQLGPSWAVIPLASLLNDEESYVRNQAIAALAGIARPATIPFLIRALRDEDEERREDARAALVLILGGQVPVVSGFVEETDEEVSAVSRWWQDNQTFYDETSCYYRGHPISLGEWIGALRSSSKPLREWLKERLKWWTGIEFDPTLDSNLPSMWEEWWKGNSGSYESGRRYFYGHPVE